MSKIILNVICLVLLSNLIAAVGIGQTSIDASLEKKIEENYQKLLSLDFNKRYEAVFFFDQLSKKDLNKKIFKTATDLLLRETERREKMKDAYKKQKWAELPRDWGYLNSEAYGMYQVYLCRLVGKSNDKNILPLLVARCPMPEVLINFSDAAVEPVIGKLLKNDNPSAKTLAINILAEFLKPKKEGYVASGETRSKIKRELIQATSDKDRYVRASSVRALGDSEDNDVIPILEKIAKNDPEHFEKKDQVTGEMKMRYPVREEAEKAIQKIKAKKVESK